MKHLRTETTYGLPSDPFVKVVDTFYLDDDGVQVHLERAIHARGYAEHIETAVEVRDPTN